ncbi:MAG: SagB/ThcOx family dehydrogenase [Ilumatobacter sp.]|nr:SagB/ThcOx family dehydrogenase [Ilumatobacter sp.]
MGRSAAALLLAAVLGVGCASDAPPTVLDQTTRYGQPMSLPAPDTDGSVPLEQTLGQRRSQREYRERPLPLATVGQLFWAGQGITDAVGRRTSPSAGARYPLELFAVTPTTFIHYLPDGHRIEQRPDDTTLPALADVAFGQSFVSDAPVVLMIAGVQARTEAEYGAVAGDLMNREAGHAAQNILLQATALGLAVVPVGGFDPSDVARLAALPPGHEVLYLIPVGYPR